MAKKKGSGVGAGKPMKLHLKKGVLHAELGVPQGQPIPASKEKINRATVHDKRKGSNSQ